MVSLLAFIGVLATPKIDLVSGFDTNILRLLSVEETCASTSSNHELKFTFRYGGKATDYADVTNEHWEATVDALNDGRGANEYPRVVVESPNNHAQLDSPYQDNTNNLIVVRWVTTPSTNGNVLPANYLTFQFQEKYYYTPSGGSEQLVTYTRKVSYQFLKNMCQDAAIDSRKSFLRVKSDSTVQVDPNAGYDNLNFGGYTYNGGLFVGFMDLGATGDYSGVARVQLYPQSAPSPDDLRYVAASLYPLGQPTGYTGQMQIGAYVPSSILVNGQSTTEGNVKWRTRWDVTIAEATGSEYPPKSYGVFNPEQGQSGNIYLTFPVTPCGEDGSHTYYQTSPQTHVDAAIALAYNKEKYSTSGGYEYADGGSRWLYMASREYCAGRNDNTTFPWNDAAPRIWYVKKGVATYESRTP